MPCCCQLNPMRCCMTCVLLCRDNQPSVHAFLGAASLCQRTLDRLAFDAGQKVASNSAWLRHRASLAAWNWRCGRASTAASLAGRRHRHSWLGSRAATTGRCQHVRPARRSAGSVSPRRRCCKAGGLLADHCTVQQQPAASRLLDLHNTRSPLSRCALWLAALPQSTARLHLLQLTGKPNHALLGCAVEAGRLFEEPAESLSCTHACSAWRRGPCPLTAFCTSIDCAELPSPADRSPSAAHRRRRVARRAAPLRVACT